MQETRRDNGPSRPGDGPADASRFLRAAKPLVFSVLALASTARADAPEGDAAAGQTRSGTPARIEIVTAPGVSSYRSAVRLFTKSVQREFHSALGFPCPADGATPIRVEVGFPRPFAMDVTHRVYRMPSGEARGVVIIPDPPAADFESIRLALVATIFKTALYSRAKQPSRATRPPVWFLRGLALHSNPAARLRLFDTAYASWSHANLPGIDALLSADSPLPGNPAVAAQVVAWCVGRGDLAGRWDRFLDYLAEGGAWNASALGAVFRDIDSLPELDDDFNLWLARRADCILDVGSTGPTALVRLRSQLLIYPWESDIHYLMRDFPAKGVPLGACLAHGDRPEVRPVLLGRARRFRLMAVGRDESFRSLCGAYAASLREALKPGGAKEAAALWEKAEDARMDMEARLAAGEILK